MSVPFVDLTRYAPGFVDRWLERVRELTLGARFVGGEAVERLEARLAGLAGLPHAVGCANGTDALQLALRASGVAPGDRVLIPAMSFWATFEAVVNVGARPVTVDIDADDLQMDFGLFQDAVARFQPRAAVLVHLYGWCSARLDDFRAYCREHGLPLIEDGAQAWGVEWQGRPVFAGAELATLSFYPAKVLGGCGDAGAVLCAAGEVAATVRRLGNHGRASHHAHTAVGWNSRLDGLGAAWLELALDDLDERLAGRRRIAGRYRRELGARGWRIAGPPEGCVENGYLNVLRVEPDRRPAVEARLREQGIGFGCCYPHALHAQPGAAGHLAGAVGGARAEGLGASVLNLPLFAGMREDELDRVVGALGVPPARIQTPPSRV